MGLLLSILVFSVGVLETLACVRHIHQGIVPVWAPRHVVTPSGRRFLRERWRKSTSRDEGGEVNGEPPPPPPPTRPRPPPLQLQDSAGAPVVHRARTPDIHWPEPVPHSPVKCAEQTLPSPVPEYAGDTSTESSWPTDLPTGRRRTSVTETLPPQEHARAQPLASTVPSEEFARETLEPRRCMPAKASSFEEARVEPAFQAATPLFAEVSSDLPKPDVINLSYEDYSASGPRAAVVGRIQITATKESNGEDEPAPWPILNIDTVALSDEEGDVTPPANSGNRRVSFDPTPTVVAFDREEPVCTKQKTEEKPLAPPMVKISHDLEGHLRDHMPTLIEHIIQEAVLKASEILSVRGRGGVSLLLHDLSQGGKDLNATRGNENDEEYKGNYEAVDEERVKESEQGVGDNIYRLMEKLQRGQRLDDAYGNPLAVNNSDLSLGDNEGTNNFISSDFAENGNILESNLHSVENEAFQTNDAEYFDEHYEQDQSEIQSGLISPFRDIIEDEIENELYVPSEEVYADELNPDHSPGAEDFEFGGADSPEVEEDISQDERETYETDKQYIYSEFETIDHCTDDTPFHAAVEVSSEHISRTDNSGDNIGEDDAVSEFYPNISQEIPSTDEDIYPPTQFSFSVVAASETVASSAPVTQDNGPEAAKEARTLAKQVSPGPQGFLDEAQNCHTSVTTDVSEETNISRTEPHTFDIEPGLPTSQDARSVPQLSAQTVPQQTLPSPQHEDSNFVAADLSPPSEGRLQDASCTAPPTLAAGPTTEKLQQATDSTPSADRNESSPNKEKKKKSPHILRKRNSKEKRSKRIQTPQASPSASEDEEDALHIVPSTPSRVAPPPPPPPVTPDQPPPTPTRYRAAAVEPEVSTGGTPSASSSGTSSSGTNAKRPTTPVAAPQSEAFWVRDSESSSAGTDVVSSPFGPIVKKPYGRRHTSDKMPVFAPKASRFEWPPKQREDRPIRPLISAAFSNAATADPKEHFPPAPPPIPERPPTPPAPEPVPEPIQSPVTAASPEPTVAGIASPTVASPEPPVTNGSAPGDTAPNVSTADEDVAREEAVSPTPQGRFKFEVEMPTTRPTIVPRERDPKEVVRKMASLKKANPGVASEMLMSILGYHVPH